MNNGPPYLLALVFGLLVSATLYMLFVWPKIEPEDEDDEDIGSEGQEDEARARVPGDPPAT